MEVRLKTNECVVGFKEDRFNYFDGIRKNVGLEKRRKGFLVSKNVPSAKKWNRCTYIVKNDTRSKLVRFSCLQNIPTSLSRQQTKLLL